MPKPGKFSADLHKQTKERIARLSASATALAIRIDKRTGRKRMPGDGDGDGIPYESRKPKAGQRPAAQADGLKITPEQARAALAWLRSQEVGESSKAPAAPAAPRAAATPKAPKPAPQKAPKDAPDDAVHAAASAALSPRQTEAFKNYCGAMFRDVNPRLRSGKPVAREDAADLREMDRAFATAATKEAMTLYRGVGGDFATALIAGASFRDGAFVSASSSKQSAENFRRGDGSAMMEIRVPKGSKAISVRDLSQFGKSEKEILLNRGGRFRVVERVNGTRTQPTKIVVEYSEND